ncbi:MAG: PAS domain S-box protein [Mucilaginibacter sp.]|nr:PAS domain S-box protein [Mucilaginibacter sp.]
MSFTITNTSLSYAVSEHLPIAIYQCDTAGNITSYNKAAAKLWGGVPDKNVRYTGSKDVLKPNGESVANADHPIARVISTGLPVEGEELIVVRVNGEAVNVLAYCVPVFDGNNILTGAVTTLIDITEQRMGERKQHILAAIIQNSEDAIVSKTLDGTITTWNNGASELFGYTEDEIIGRPITTVIPVERLDEEADIIGKISKGQKVDHFVTYRLHKSGEEIPVSLAISPIKDADGNIVGASKIARNITKQLEADGVLQRYAENLEVLNNIGRVISENLDVQEILQKVTDATTTLTGAAFGAFFYNKEDEKGESYQLYTLTGAPREAFDKLGMPRNTAVFSHTFGGLGVVRVDDITKDERYGHNSPHRGMPKGHLPVVSYLAVPVISKSSEVIGGLFLGHPEPAKFTKEHENLVVSVASQASIALDNAKLYEEIQKLNSKKDEFIGLASHELKTPMTSLNGYLQIIDRSLGEDDRNKSFIKKALIQINKLSDLISDLLDVSKIEAGLLPLNYSDFHLDQMVDEVVELMQHSTKSHSIVICATETKLLISADKQRLEQVIINLLSNAIKYSPEADHINVTLSADSKHAIIEVQDFGIGINKEQQRRIFSRFYRVEDVASHISGLGIGLYISNEIINRHNGKLSVNSNAGKGSTFRVEVPVKNG